jgi:hypothetical protein
MNRSLAALAAAAMLAASVPAVSFAEDAGDTSSSASTVSSESSSASSVSSESSSSASSVSSSSASRVKGCDDLKGLRRAQCQAKLRIEKKMRKNRVQRRAEDKAIRINTDCAAKDGMERLKCLRTNGKRGIKSFIQKKSKFDRPHTIRGKKIEASSSASN